MAKVVGIDADASAVECARNRLDLVYHADVETDSAPFIGNIGESTLDCIIYDISVFCGRNADRVVERHLAFIAKYGSILLHLPNPNRWNLAEELLKGCLTEANSAHRSTQERIRSMLSNSGFVIHDSTQLSSDQAGFETFANRLEPSLLVLGIDPESYRLRAAPSDCILRARGEASETRLTVNSTMLSPVGGVSDVRVVEPMQALKAEPSLLTIISSSAEPPPEPMERPKIFIFHRPLLAGEPGLEQIRGLLKAGWIIVCEFDDHPQYIPVLRRSDIQNFRAVHAIQTTTGPLASVLREYNPEVAVFDNGISALPDIANFESDNFLTLFFAGLNRDEDWPEYIDTMNAVSERFGARLRFEVVNDRRFFDALQTPHKRFTPLCDYNTYKTILSTCEISFMPLSDTPFNRCKSDLKFIEAAAHRVVALCSDVAYSDSVDRYTAVLFRTSSELERRLTDLILNRERARVIGNDARRYVRDNRMLSYQLSRRARWYSSLWNRRAELNESLALRVPELDRTDKFQGSTPSELRNV